MAEIPADDVEVERRPHDHSGVAAQNGDGVALAEIQAAEQVVKIAEADRTCGNAEKASVRAGDAPAEHDGISAAMQQRAADEQAGIGMIAMNPEVLLIAAILRCRIERRGAEDR